MRPKVNYALTIVLSIVVLIVGFDCGANPSAAEETEILKISVGAAVSFSGAGIDDRRAASGFGSAVPSGCKTTR